MEFILIAFKSILKVSICTSLYTKPDILITVSTLYGLSLPKTTITIFTIMIDMSFMIPKYEWYSFVVANNFDSYFFRG